MNTSKSWLHFWLAVAILWRTRMIYNYRGCLQVLYFCPIFFSISNTPNKSKWQLVCLPRFFSSFIEKSRGVRECRNSEGTAKSRNAKNSPNHLMGVSRVLIYQKNQNENSKFCYYTPGFYFPKNLMKLGYKKLKNCTYFQVASMA